MRLARQTCLLAVAVVASHAARGESPAGTGRFPPGTGQPQVQAACAPCHAVTVVTSARKSAAEWERLVEVMITRGARVSDADFDVIVDYLIRNFSASASDAAAAHPRPALPTG
jgi:hypothetical protein